MLSVVMFSAIMLSVVMLSVIMLSVILLSVIMLSAVMLSVVMLSVVMLSVIMVNVMATSSYTCLVQGSHINIFLSIHFIFNCFPAIGFSLSLRLCYETFKSHKPIIELNFEGP